MRVALTVSDDIQGTGCVTLAALQSALKVTKIPLEKQKIIVYGAGSAVRMTPFPDSPR